MLKGFVKNLELQFEMRYYHYSILKSKFINKNKKKNFQ